MQEHSFDFLSVQLEVLDLSYFLSMTFLVTELCSIHAGVFENNTF